MRVYKQCENEGGDGSVEHITAVDELMYVKDDVKPKLQELRLIPPGISYSSAYIPQKYVGDLEPPASSGED